jgi:hypothetical protein
MNGRREECTGFWENPLGKQTTGETLSRLGDNIKMDLTELGYGVWTGLGWLRIET